MERKAERYLILGGAIWNIVASILTIFGYSSWFKNEGSNAFLVNNQVSYLNSSLLDSLTHVVMIYGLFVLVMGIINLYITRFFNKTNIDKKVIIWIGVCVAVSFLSFDVISVFFYLSALIIYMARKKSIKLANISSKTS